MAIKKKRKTTRATRAPGKSDPQFLSRLSRAMEEEIRSGNNRASSDDEEAQALGAKKPQPNTVVSKKAKPSSSTRPRSSAPKKTNPAPRGPSKRSNENNRTRLLKELRALITELDEEGLAFLLEQAHIHRYNMEVERLNEAEERSASSRTVKKRTRSSPSAGNTTGSALRIERSKDGNTYHIISNGRYKMFSAEEMLSLVRIAHANPDEIEAGRGLFRWMSRERTDALADLGISGPADPDLSALARLLRSSFAKPGRKE